MNLIALAAAPGIAICLFIFYRDRYNKEPLLNLILTFFLGILAAVPAVIIEFAFNTNASSIAMVAVQAFLVVALTEELCKFAVLRWYSYPKKSFDEPLDGIVYGVVASMGFATIENILYVTRYAEMGMGYQVALMRMFLSVPAHATFGILMGYYVGLAKFATTNKTQLIFKGIFWATLMHGVYDFLLFLQGHPDVKAYISDTGLFLGAVVSFIIGIRLSLKHIKTHQRLSQKTHHPTELMKIRKATVQDIPTIQQLAYDSWPATYGSILSAEQIEYMLSSLYSSGTIEKDMQQNEFILVYDGTVPVGFAAFGRIAPDTAKLHKIYFLPQMQGKGFGKLTLQQIVVALKKKGIQFLHLNVNRYNPAKSFYEKVGFQIIREEDIDIGNGYFMNDYVMEMKIV
jgi:RsiW-degrading membrane proteinase PrsW (M82 family)/ribosomal protein S18 acetylase RimI-like enzyme